MNYCVIAKDEITLTSVGTKLSENLPANDMGIAVDIMRIN